MHQAWCLAFTRITQSSGSGVYVKILNAEVGICCGRFYIPILNTYVLNSWVPKSVHTKTVWDT